MYSAKDGQDGTTEAPGDWLPDWQAAPQSNDDGEGDCA